MNEDEVGTAKRRRVHIGIDWGGTKIEAIALSEEGHTLGRVRTDTPRSDYPGCLAAVRSLVSGLEEKFSGGTVGVGIPGSVDPRTGIAKGASSTWLNGRPVQRDLEAVLGREVRLANDADCLAVSEAVDGAGAGYRVVFAVILGSGAGAGIAINGEAHSGPNNSAGEWGHNPLPLPGITEIPGPPCYCGKHGCLERWVSGWSFSRDYAAHASIDLQAQALPEPRAIVAAMRDGDRLARLVWERYVDRVARGLSLVLNSLDPDVFVLAGGMSNVEELYEQLPDRLAHYAFSPCFYTPVVRAAHGDSSGVRGAAWLWNDRA